MSGGEQAALVSMMERHGVKLDEIFQVDIRLRKVTYLILQTDADSHRFIDPETGVAAVRREVHER